MSSLRIFIVTRSISATQVIAATKPRLAAQAAKAEIVM
jgi:hypothetical protein